VAALHVPVLLERTLALLAPAADAPGAVVVDATLGLGGHSAALLERHPALRLVGLDRDLDALAHSRARLAPYADRTVLVHAVYDELPEVLSRLGLGRVQGVLFDLGVSSLQLDETERGFSYSHDAPLDMRMDRSTGRTAAEVLNTYPAEDLARILRAYGEERFARRIAERVVREREREPFTTSARLADLVRESIPAATRRTGGNPSKRTFQALRIEVNGELEVLARAIPASLQALAVGGRAVVMSYHSLEDRLVKQALAAGAATNAPPDLPVVPEHLQPWLRLITRGAETASDAEVAENPRAASVRLRAAERIRDAA
jgi:16S rRNA (cytosine1402-N4)-methyltransferase